MRLSTQPNTSININFPMYLGHPYHSAYQYQHNPLRYPGQPISNNSATQYTQGYSAQTKQLNSQYSAGNNSLSSLPPYAEYQEYKKRENDRRRWNIYNNWKRKLCLLIVFIEIYTTIRNDLKGLYRFCFNKIYKFV